MVVTQLYLFAKIHELYTKDGKLMVTLVLIVFLEGYRAIRKCPFFFWIMAAGCIKYPMTFRDGLLGASLLLLETLPLPSLGSILEAPCIWNSEVACLGESCKAAF